jgi:hypothetical protein
MMDLSAAWLSCNRAASFIDDADSVSPLFSAETAKARH